MSTTVFEDFVGQLHCPHCGQAFSADILPDDRGNALRPSGILTCSCAQYPVLSGIPIIKAPRYATYPTYETAVELLKDGFVGEAISAVLEQRFEKRPGFLGRLQSRAAAFLASRKRRMGSESDFEMARHSIGTYLTTHASEPFVQYLRYRYLNPGYVSTLAVFLAVLSKPVKGDGPACLDLGCGIGHVLHLMQQHAPGGLYVGVDIDFRNLYLARQLLPENCLLICMDAEAPLPFADATFDRVVSLDALHYIRGKRLLFTEFDRVATNDARFLFSHLHNREAENLSPGLPLDARSYLACASSLNPRLFSEDTVLRDFVLNDEVHLEAPIALDGRAAPKAFTMFACRDDAVWRAHDNVTGSFAVAQGALRLNPAFRLEQGNGGSHARLHWPAEWMRDECAGLAEMIESVPMAATGRVADTGDFSLRDLALKDVSRSIRHLLLVADPLPEVGNPTIRPRHMG